jgi:hypothetical protein
VFLNVPFDRQYRRLFDALVFAIHDCGLCQFGIHDLSRTSLDRVNRLPRFNMPLELGLFLGAKRFGHPRNARKSALILERRPFRYQIYCSDLAGQDIRAHSDNTLHAVVAVRNWLQSAGSTPVMSGRAMAIRYQTFRQHWSGASIGPRKNFLDSTFIDYRTQVDVWRADNP